MRPFVKTHNVSQVDSAFYPPEDGNMSTSHRVVMLCGWEGNCLAESNSSLPPRVDDLSHLRADNLYYTGISSGPNHR